LGVGVYSILSNQLPENEESIISGRKVGANLPESFL